MIDPPAMVDSIDPQHHPAEVFRGRNDMWLTWATGRLESGAWGLVPFSALLGSLRNADPLTFVIDVVGRTPGT